MKGVLIVAGIVLSNFYSYSQQQLAEFPLTWYLQKAEAFEVGDSLYVTYSDIIGHHDRKQAAWISDAGKISKFELGPIAGVDLIEVVRQRDDYFFYFLERDKKNNITKLKAQQFNRITQRKHIVEEELVFTGIIVAIFKETDLHIICLDPKTGALTAHVIAGMKVTATHTISLKISVSPIKVSDIEFYNSSQLSGANTGATPFKIIKQEKVLYLTADENDKATIIKIDLPSYTVQKFILGQSTPSEFNTFVCDDVIYKLTADKGVLTLDLYQLQSLEKLTSLKSFYKYLAPYQSYERYGFEHKIERKKNFDPTVAPLGVYAPHWAIVAASNGQESNSIRLGIYYNEKRPIGVYLGDIVVFVLSTVAAQLSEGPGISRYIYFSERKDHSRLTDKEGPLTMSQAQKADNYEISMKKKSKIMYKGYATLNGRLIGIYGSVDKKVRFVKF